MEAIRHKSSSNKKSRKLAKTIQKVISLKTATKNNGICILTSQAKVKEDPFTDQFKAHNFSSKQDDAKVRNRAIMEAFVSKLFAGVTSIKAAYAELQMAQSPYDNEAIQAADQTIVEELKAISELKRKFLKKELDLSPQVTLLLAEIKEQQSLMRTYEITVKKMEAESELKDLDISSLKKQLDESISFNKSLEKKLNSSGCLSMLDNVRLSVLNPTHFVQFLHYTLRSIRSFTKLMIKEMDSANWDLDEAVKFIQPEAIFAKPSHRIFAFESFVCITMFEGFNHPSFMISSETLSLDHKTHHHHSQQQHLFYEKFNKLKSLNPKQYITQKPCSSFAKFTKSKYLQLVHAKMECSLFGNLNMRKLVNSGGFPDSAFFIAFAEMAKRVRALHYLAFSFNEEVTIFQIKKNCRFSEVYMECTAEESTLPYSSDSDIPGGELMVGFTVIPGFKMGKTVIQSQVYLLPAKG